MGSISIWHWLIVLLVVALVFGTSKLRNIGSDLGGAVKDFKKNMRPDNQPVKQVNRDDHVIEGEITRKTHSKA